MLVVNIIKKLGKFYISDGTQKFYADPTTKILGGSFSKSADRRLNRPPILIDVVEPSINLKRLPKRDYKRTIG